jgi:hypothetical protein
LKKGDDHHEQDIADSITANTQAPNILGCAALGGACVLAYAHPESVARQRRRRSTEQLLSAPLGFGRF